MESHRGDIIFVMHFLRKMKEFFGLAVLASSIQLSCAENQKPMNVLLICVDDLRPELQCYGKQYIHSPNIDSLAASGVLFERHYVQAPTCGASRYTLLTGRYGPYGNGALFARARKVTKDKSSVPMSLPAWFKDKGYSTVSVGKVSHHPGGRGGSDWDDNSVPEMPLSWNKHLLPSGDWMHPRGVMHGLAHGEIRKNAKDMDLYQALPGSDSIYPDGLIIDEALSQMDQLSGARQKDGSPFFLAVGIIRPHLPFGAPLKYMEHYQNANLPIVPHPEKPSGISTWHGSGEFMKYNRWGRNPNSDDEFSLLVRKHYAACVTYADALVGRLLKKLEELKQSENTVIILWGDHGWHLGEHSVWGKHTLFEESLRSPLIIVKPGMKESGAKTKAIVETIDIFPTLCDLAGIEKPNFVHGQSLAPILADPALPGHEAISYTSLQTIRNDQYRLIYRSKNGEHELYDHSSPAKETKNVADKFPEIVKSLSNKLNERLAQRDKN